MASRSVRVLGIDPGLTRCGFGVIDMRADRSATLVAVGVLRTDPELPIEQRLLAIGDGLDALLAEHAPTAVAVERVFAQQNLRTVMGTAQAAGLVLERAARAGLPVASHTPSEVKAAVTGYGSADKRQVAAMVARILRLSAPPSPADAADALALALCHGWSRGAAEPGAPGASTPAQQAWRDAERHARARRT